MYKEYKEAWAELISVGADFEIEKIDVRGASINTYKNALPTLKHMWERTRQFGDRDYLVYQAERISYTDAHKNVDSVATWLLQNEVSHGDRVAIAMRNYPEWLLSYWATLSVGASVVGMNAWWTEPEMLYAIEDSKPKVIFLDQERLNIFSGISAELSFITPITVRAESADTGLANWNELLDTEPEANSIEIQPDDDACIFYTSGTTGRPKGAQLTHRGCISNIWSMMFSASLQRLIGEKKGLLEPGADPIIPSALVTTPLFHVTANNCAAHATTIAGGRLTHMYKWDAGEALKIVEAEKITSLSGVPVMAREIITHPDFDKTDTSSLMTVGGGGAQLQPDLVTKIEERVTTARPSTGYGMTETCGIITSIGGDYFIDKPESCGPATPAYEVKIVDPSSTETLPKGETGELWVRGGHVIKGYLNRPEATEETIVDGWLRTGDMAKMDEDDFIYIVDRIKDMVLRGGENIYCAEVESAIFDHPAVSECTVFGVPDDRLGEEVGAAVFVGNNKLDATELREHCRNLIASFKVPKYVWFMDEPLPRNASGKFLKRELREKLSINDSV